MNTESNKQENSPAVIKKLAEVERIKIDEVHKAELLKKLVIAGKTLWEILPSGGKNKVADTINYPVNSIRNYLISGTGKNIDQYMKFLNGLLDFFTGAEDHAKKGKEKAIELISEIENLLPKK